MGVAFFVDFGFFAFVLIVVLVDKCRWLVVST